MVLTNNITIMRNDSQRVILDRLSIANGKGFYRKGSYSTEIIWADRKFVFPSNKKSGSFKDLWIFRNVINDVKEYCLGRRIKELPKLPVNYWNPKIEKAKGRIAATDLNHAYWRIAFLNGFISSKTYEKGLLIKDKALRLASLANLSSNKQYFLIERGQVTKKSVTLRFEPALQKVYNNIRYECFNHMMTMADLLGDDFICYKTDCIYYKQTKKNVELVCTYLDSIGLDYKQLIETDRPEREDITDQIKREPSGTNLPDSLKKLGTN
jgi:hypothetical protein